VAGSGIPKLAGSGIPKVAGSGIPKVAGSERNRKKHAGLHNVLQSKRAKRRKATKWSGNRN